MFLVSHPFYAIFYACHFIKKKPMSAWKSTQLCVSVFCVFPPPLFHRHGNGVVAELTIASSRGLRVSCLLGRVRPHTFQAPSRAALPIRFRHNLTHSQLHLSSFIP